MDFNFTDEQKMLRDSARGFCEKMSPMGYVLEMEKSEKGYTPELWNAMVELGWMGLIIPEEYGGVGMGFMDLIVLLEEMGRMCVPGPFFSTVILGGYTLLTGGSEEQKNEYLPRIAAGELVFSFAYTEPGMIKFDPSHVTVTAKAEGESFVIDGTKLFVSDANVADFIIVSARTSGEANDKKGISLFLVDAKDPGISITQLSTLAGDKQCEVVFKGVTVPKANLIGALDDGWSVMEKVMLYASVGKCAEMVGGSMRVLDLVLDYCHQRVQFGKPIGVFQAVQHHCANMAINLQGSKFITYKAAWMLDEGMPATRICASAKAWVSEAYKRFVILGHQVFAGTGFMVEHEMPMYSRRARAAELAFGDAPYYRKVVAQDLKLG
ncbi:MAG TPA: acyl-CoA dehydrogenase [Deltaproteobacteria bacterium]|nr:acyl-CoA dehydrogenase [Deltaproteobacteria bacterium]